MISLLEKFTIEAKNLRNEELNELKKSHIEVTAVRLRKHLEL